MNAMKRHPDNISRQKCFNHADREAAALCLYCRNYFCRECVTEHETKVVCADCLSNVQAPADSKNRLKPVLHICLFTLSVFFLWFLFFQFGRFLLKMPDSFHDGTLWKTLWQSI